MAFLKETPGSMRVYLVVIGLLGAAFGLLGAISSVVGPVWRVIFLVSLAMSVAYVVVGFSLKSLLSANPDRIEQVLIAGAVWFTLVRVAAVLFEGSFGALVDIPVGVIITVYLLKQVRRLAEGGQSASPTASSTEFTSIRRKQEP